MQVIIFFIIAETLMNKEFHDMSFYVITSLFIKGNHDEV